MIYQIALKGCKNTPRESPLYWLQSQSESKDTLQIGRPEFFIMGLPEHQPQEDKDRTFSSSYH